MILSSLTTTDYEYVNDKTKADDDSAARKLQDLLCYELPAQVRHELEAEIIRELEPIEADLRRRLPEIIHVVLRRLLAINTRGGARKEQHDDASLDVDDHDGDFAAFSVAVDSEYLTQRDEAGADGLDNFEDISWPTFPCDEFDWMISDAFRVSRQGKDFWTENLNSGLGPQDHNGNSGGSTDDFSCN